MSLLGQSRHSWCKPKSPFVRFTPLATVLGTGPKGRNVPILLQKSKIAGWQFSRQKMKRAAIAD
jgi:hypothetical protein